MQGEKTALMVACALAVAAVAPLRAAEAPIATVSPTEQALAAGLAAFQRGDYVEARATFRMLAGQDVPTAETLLGTMTAKGQGGPKDEAVAAAWFMRAARRGYAPAQLALADAFAKGRGVPINQARAQALAKAAMARPQPAAAQLVSQQGISQLARR